MTIIDTVSYANFRLATEDEVQEARGGYCWRALSGTWNLLSRIEGSIEMFRKGGQLLTWNTPYLDRLSDRVSLLRGYDDVNFIHQFSNFLADFFFIDRESAVMKALFKVHRMDTFFEYSIGTKKFIQILEDTFPDKNISPNDFILSCDKFSTKTYHQILNDFLKLPKVHAFIPTIQSIAEDTLRSWEDRRTVNLTDETSLYVASNFTRLLFGDDLSDKELAKAIHFVNLYVMTSVMWGTTEQGKLDYFNALATIQRVTEEVLANEKLALFKESDLTDNQKRGTIFAILFGGQETTSDLLIYVLWKLALNSELQEELRQEVLTMAVSANQRLEKINRLFSQCIQEFTPAFGVARRCKEDLCLEYRLQGDDSEAEPRKRIFYKGQIIGARISEFAKHKTLREGESHEKLFVFGQGPHICPGRMLAVEEVNQFVIALLKDYTITTDVKSLEIQGHVTLRVISPTPITIVRRQKEIWQS